MAAEGPRLLALIEQGLANNDLAAVEDAAHSLKSSCGALNLNASAELALRLETVVRNGTLSDPAGLAETLRGTFDRELAAVRAFVERKAQDEAAA